MQPEKLILKYSQKLIEHGLVYGSFGNISIKRNEKIYITPSGINYSELKEKDISAVNINSDGLLKGLKPSREYLMHKKIYKANKNLSSVIHTHSEYLTAVSIIKEEIPAITEEQVVTLGPSIICLDYFPSGSLKLAEETSKYFKKYKGLMLSNHGYVGAGRDIKEAFLNCRIAEKCARIYLKIKPYLKKNMILNKKNIDEYLNRGEK